MDHIETMPSKRIEIYIHRVMVVTLKRGPDHVYLETNMPNPMGAGTVAFSFPVPRDTGEIYARTNYPGVEVVVYHYGIGGGGFAFSEREGHLIARAHEQQNPQLPTSAGGLG